MTDILDQETSIVEDMVEPTVATIPVVDIDDKMLTLTTRIVAAHIGRNEVPLSELPDVIEQVYNALVTAQETLGRPMRIPSLRLTPAVAIRKSVTPDYIICLEDGKKLKMLKRHLKAVYGMSVQEYKERWGLPADYPMVAPNYAKKRSHLAKNIGLGTIRGKKETAA